MTRKPTNPRACPVLWHGEVYPSQAELARRLGTTTRLIRYHLDRHGNLDRLGKGRGSAQKLGAPISANIVPAKTVTVGGRTWPSISAFARYVSRSRSTVLHWRRRGRLDLMVAALMAADAGVGE